MTCMGVYNVSKEWEVIEEQAQESALGVESKIIDISGDQGWCHGESFLVSWHIA